MPGAELIKNKVKFLSVMGGQFPRGTEWNFQSDAIDWQTLVSTWTAQKGYPPIYFNGIDNGEEVISGPPNTPPDNISPVLKAFELAGYATRPSWDELSILFAAREFSYEGTRYFADSGSETITVDGESGANSWSNRVCSGHHYITNVASASQLAALVNALVAEPPHNRRAGMAFQPACGRALSHR